MRKAIVFGLGWRYRYLNAMIFDEYHVIALADNDPDKQGLVLDGLPVIRPCAISGLEFDTVLVTVQGKAAGDITKQLMQIGIPRSKIDFYDKGLSPFLIDPQYFTKNLTYEQKKCLFKNNVELVYIEFNSQCNRRCWMCPNSVLDRHSKNIKLKHGTLIKVLSELREIDYDADVSFSIYNEPMIDSALDKNIKTVKRYLPNAPLHFNTNGDYLTPKRLAELEVLGLDFLPVSVYVDTAKKPWTYNDAVRLIKRKVKTLNLEIEALSVENDTVVNAVCKYKSLYVFFHCANHRIVACDRGGSVPETAPVRRITESTKLCDRFFTLFTINYSGSVTACCNFLPDLEDHRPFVVGDVRKENIFDIYACEQWNQIRRQHICDISDQPCNTCGVLSEAYTDTALAISMFLPFRDRPRFRSRKHGID